MDGLAMWNWYSFGPTLVWYVDLPDCTATAEVTGGVDTGIVNNGHLTLRGHWMSVHTAMERGKGMMHHAHEVECFRYPNIYQPLETASTLPYGIQPDSTIIYDTKNDMPREAFCIPMLIRPDVDS